MRLTSWLHHSRTDRSPKASNCAVHKVFLRHPPYRLIDSHNPTSPVGKDLDQNLRHYGFHGLPLVRSTLLWRTYQRTAPFNSRPQNPVPRVGVASLGNINTTTTASAFCCGIRLFYRSISKCFSSFCIIPFTHEQKVYDQSRILSGVASRLADPLDELREVGSPETRRNSCRSWLMLLLLYQNCPHNHWL